MAKETTTKRQLATHGFIDAQGNVLTGDDEIFEKAHGIVYTDKASGATTKRLPGNADALRMHAVFGMRTLATNVASAARQQDDAATGADQITAINERFDLIDGGTWVDRSREGPQYDIEQLAWAAVDVAKADGKVPDDNVGVKLFESFRQKMEDDKSVIAKIRSVAGVEQAYKVRVGKKQGTVDDLMALAS